MYYIESSKTDPYWNLALEQYVFDELGREQDCFMLWQNDKTIVVGKHQNTIEEIDPEYVKRQGIRVARRLSGGGAVYHDLGNINFTFVSNNRDGNAFEFSTFCRPVADALRQIGVPAEINGRNDMTIQGQKFSGNAQYRKHGRIMHHGTLLFDSDLEEVGRALQVKPDKVESKGLKSVRSRVTNIRPYVKDPAVSVSDFWNILRDYMFRSYPMEPYSLTEDDIRAVDALRDTVYSRWEWIYGTSPDYSIRKERRVEGCGMIQVYMEVEGGKIRQIAFRGDYFSLEDSGALEQLLQGVALEEHALVQALHGCDISRFFANLDLEAFLSVLLQ